MFGIADADEPVRASRSRCLPLLPLTPAAPLRFAFRPPVCALCRLRVIWVFTFLVFAAVVFIIVYKNLKKKSGNDGETLVPEIPKT